MKVPKGIKDAAKGVDFDRFTIVRRSKHYALADRASGKIVMTLHSNGGRAGANRQADFKRRGMLKGGS